MNNFEKMKFMTIEELSNFLYCCLINIENCDDCPIKNFCDKKWEQYESCEVIIRAWLEEEE